MTMREQAFSAEDELARLRDRVTALESEALRLRKAHDEACRSRDLYRHLVDAAEDGIWRVDVEGKFTYVGRSVHAMFGYEPDILLGKPFDITLTETSATEAWDAFCDTLLGKRTPDPELFEFQHLRKDGSRFWGESVICAIRDAQGTVVELQGITRDISQRREAAEARRDSEERFRRVFEDAPIAMAITDASFHFLAVNPVFTVMLGYSSEDMQGRTFVDITHPDNIEANTRQSKRLANGDIPVYRTEKRYITKTNAVVWGLVHVSAVRNDAGEFLYFVVMINDITERKRAEEALRESLAELATIYDSAPFVMLLLDSDLRICKANAIASYAANRQPMDMIGLRGGEALRCLNALKDPRGCGFAPSCEQCLIRCSVQDTFLTGKSHQNVEVWLPFQEEGGVVDRCLLISTARIDVDGTVRILVCAEEITERKHAEKALRDSQELYSSLVDHLPQSVFRKDADGRFVFCNQRFCDSQKRTMDEILGKTDSDLFPQEMAEAYSKDDQWVMSQRETLDQVERHVDAEGNLSYVQIVKTPLYAPSGEVSGVQGIFWDVTERWEQDEALRTLSRFNEEVIAEAGEGIIVYDRELRYRIWNPFMETMTGIASADILGKRALDVFPHLCEQGVDQLLQEALAGKTVRSHDVPFTSSQKGKTGWVVGTYAPHRDSEGRIVGVIATIRDISERKRLEAERLELERRLLHAQKLESIGILAGGIAHDFNNLLMAVIGNLDLALEDLPISSTSRVNIERAIGASKRAADLTRQLLAYSGKGLFVLEHLDLSEMVRENARMLRATIPRNVTLELRLEMSLPSVLADPGQIQQVIMNLITNAAEAVGDEVGSVCLVTGEVDCDAEYLSHSCVGTPPPPGLYVWLEVTDNGCGMDIETKERLFEPFFTTKFVGRGLGLSAVQGIVLGHNGALLLESEPGEGTTVRVLFPVSETTGALQGPVQEKVPRVDKGSREQCRGVVLLADDEEDVRNLCVRMLARLGFEPVEAADGEEAVAIFRERADEIACVVLDLAMPRMDGLEVFDAIQQTKPGIPIILCSGYDEKEATKRFGQRGVMGFLQKPYRFETLRAILSRIPTDDGHV